MFKPLLEQLPEIVAKGRRQAEKILESPEGRHRAGLQTLRRRTGLRMTHFARTLRCRSIESRTDSKHSCIALER